mmetsp:Transcript_47666/g.112182  ORF Transcript_47666/g.112182 Transcript_47666/m.112182 type:complete len:225 (+) Transcript_47666:26-700(+)
MVANVGLAKGNKPVLWLEVGTSHHLPERAVHQSLAKLAPLPCCQYVFVLDSQGLEVSELVVFGIRWELLQRLCPALPHVVGHHIHGNVEHDLLARAVRLGPHPLVQTTRDAEAALAQVLPKAAAAAVEGSGTYWQTVRPYVRVVTQHVAQDNAVGGHSEGESGRQEELPVFIVFFFVVARLRFEQLSVPLHLRGRVEADTNPFIAQVHGLGVFERLTRPEVCGA